MKYGKIRWASLGGCLVVGLTALWGPYGCGQSEPTCEGLNCLLIGGATGTGSGGEGGTAMGSGGIGGVGGVGGVGGNGGAGGAIGPEVCTNGLDDDGDGLVDCADVEDCNAYACTTALPPGDWEGYFQLVEGPYVENYEPLVCPNGGTVHRYFRTPAGTPTCKPCVCDPNEVIPCTNPELKCWDQPGCSGLSQSKNFLGCVTGGSLESCFILDSPKEDGTCTAGGGGMVPEPPWGDQVEACEVTLAEGAGCGSDEVCLAKDQPESQCIRTLGSPSVCPSGWQARPPLHVHLSAMDTRKCEACSCSAGSCSGGKYRAFSEPACPIFAGTSKDIDVIGSCVTLGFQMKSVESYGWAATGCKPVEETPMASGKMTPTDAYTFCCKDAAP